MELIDDEKRRISRALTNARTALRAKMIEPEGPAIIFKVIEDAVVDVERRMKLMTREPPKHLRGAYLQYLHEGDDWIDIVKRCKIDEAAGVPLEIAWGWTLITTPGELEIMEAVEKVFRDCLMGKNKRRDWQILLRLAGYRIKTKTAAKGRFTEAEIKKVTDALVEHRGNKAAAAKGLKIPYTSFLRRLKAARRGNFASNTERSIAKDFHISQHRVNEIKKLQCAVIWRQVRDFMPLEVSGRILRAVA